MYSYQTKLNIKKQCVVNTVFYMDMINAYFPTEKCIPNVGILHYYDTSLNMHIQVNHCWCLLNGKIIDPSIEYVKLPYKKTYYSNLQEYFEFCKKYGVLSKKQKIDTISKTCNLQKMINQFVKNKKITTDYYDKMRDYINCIYKDNENAQSVQTT
jgi:hypothetical protein